jgi:hypothetical protein
MHRQQSLIKKTDVKFKLFLLFNFYSLNSGTDIIRATTGPIGRLKAR